MRVLPARTMIGTPPVARLPAPAARPSVSTGDDRARMIQHTRRYAAAARRWGFHHVAGICELAASALEALDDAEQRLALLLRAERFDEQTVPINPEALRRARAAP